MKTIKVNDYAEVPNNFTGIIEFSSGQKRWYKEGLFHRKDGPAIEFEDGQKEWWVENNLHRTEGPAIEWANGEKGWWIDGNPYIEDSLEYFFEISIYLGKQKGKYNLDWLRFLTDEGIKEFPIIPGMEIDEGFSPLLKRVFEVSK